MAVKNDADLLEAKGSYSGAAQGNQRNLRRMSGTM
jgi:hypothetical protein